jgi:hypothetical protein
MLLRPDLVGIGIDEQTALVVQGRHASAVGFGGGSVWFHFADPGTEAVYRYRVGLGETLTLPTPVLETSAPALEEGLRALRPPDILTVPDLSPDPLEGYPVKDLLARRAALRGPVGGGLSGGRRSGQFPEGQDVPDPVRGDVAGAVPQPPAMPAEPGAAHVHFQDQGGVQGPS